VEHNAIKYFPNLARLGERAFGLDDNEQSITRLSETLQGSVDLWSQPEFALYRGDVIFARAPATIVAVVARFGIASLINPVGSNTIAVLRQAYMSGATASLEAAVGGGGSVAANPVTTQGVAIDTRYPPAGESSVCTIVTGDVAAGITLPQWVTQAANNLTTITPMLPVIIIPGRKVDWINTTANQPYRIQLVWTERKPFPGELFS